MFNVLNQCNFMINHCNTTAIIHEIWISNESFSLKQFIYDHIVLSAHWLILIITYINLSRLHQKKFFQYQKLLFNHTHVDILFPSTTKFFSTSIAKFFKRRRKIIITFLKNSIFTHLSIFFTHICFFNTS